MKRIAVTYDNGRIFQHFGRTEAFKIYETENGTIVSGEVVSAGGAGHSALAGFLASEEVDAVICGGLGGGAQAALADAGIEVIAGIEGDADEAVQKFLRGELVSSGVNCDHHGEGHHCGHHEEEAEGGCCGHHGNGGCCGRHGEGEEGCCGGGCHGRRMLEGPNAGKTCRVHYRGTFNDGTQFDSSYDRGEPLEFICGVGMMIPGFDAAVVRMAEGEEIDLHLMPEEAYGPSDPNRIFTAEIAKMPGSENLSVGEQVYLANHYGQQFPAAVTEKTDTTVTFDANHEMAGKELNFHIKLVEVVEPEEA